MARLVLHNDRIVIPAANRRVVGCDCNPCAGGDCPPFMPQCPVYSDSIEFTGAPCYETVPEGRTGIVFDPMGLHADPFNPNFPGARPENTEIVSTVNHPVNEAAFYEVVWTIEGMDNVGINESPFPPFLYRAPWVRLGCRAFGDNTFGYQIWLWTIADPDTGENPYCKVLFPIGSDPLNQQVFPAGIPFELRVTVGWNPDTENITYFGNINSQAALPVISGGLGGGPCGQANSIFDVGQGTSSDTVIDIQNDAPDCIVTGTFGGSGYFV